MTQDEILNQLRQKKFALAAQLQVRTKRRDGLKAEVEALKNRKQALIEEIEFNESLYGELDGKV